MRQTYIEVKTKGMSHFDDLWILSYMKVTMHFINERALGQSQTSLTEVSPISC